MLHRKVFQDWTQMKRIQYPRAHSPSDWERMGRGWPRISLFLSFFPIFFLSSLSPCYWQPLSLVSLSKFSIFYVFCRFYLGRVYFLVPPLSLYLSLTPASSVFLLPTSVTTATITVTKTIPFFPSGAKDASPYEVLVICLYVYKHTRQPGEEQQFVVVECGRASDGAVS